MILEVLCPKCNLRSTFDVNPIAPAKGLITSMECPLCEVDLDITFDVDEKISVVYISCEDENGKRRKS